MKQKLPIALGNFPALIDSTTNAENLVTNKIYIDTKRRTFQFKKLFLSIAIWAAIINAQAAAPTITGLSANSGVTGASITITGTGFNTTAASNIVYFGATKATVSTASTTSLSVTVPGGATYNYITEINIGSGINLSCKSPTKFLPIFTPVTNPFNTGLFDAVSTLAMPAGTTGISSIAVGDLDGDGKPDLVFSYVNNAEIAVFRNTSTSGTISFAAGVTFATPSPSGPYTLALADIDGDGKLDIAVVNSTATSGTAGLSIFRNTASSGSFTTSSLATIQNFATGSGSMPEGLVIGDIDGDGKPDIVVADEGNNLLSLFQNTSTAGTISLATKVDVNSGDANPVYMAMGDVDNDGRPDIIVGFDFSGGLSVFHNNGTLSAGKFSPTAGVTLNTPTFLSTGANVTSGGWTLSDIDGDGFPDIVGVTPGPTNGPLNIFQNTNSSAGTVSFGSGVEFTTSSPVIQAIGAWGIDVGDLDGDGKPDVVTSTRNNIQAYQNTATAGTIQNGTTLQRQVNFATSATNPTKLQGSVIIADLDGDGRPDMVAGDFSTVTTAFIFRNDPHTLVVDGLSGDSISGGPFCGGANINIPFTSTGTFKGGNQYQVQLSSTTVGNNGFQQLFSSGTNVEGTLSSTANSGNIPVTIDPTLPGGIYYLRILSTLPPGISDTVIISINSPSGFFGPLVCTNGMDTAIAMFTVNDPGAGNTVFWSTDGISDNDGSEAGGLGDTSNIYQNNKAVSQGNPVTEYVQVAYATCTSAFIFATASAAQIPAAATGLTYPTVCGDSGYATFMVNNPPIGFFIAASFNDVGIDSSGFWSTVVDGDGFSPPSSFSTNDVTDGWALQVYAGSPFLFIAELIDESSGCFALDTSYATAYDTLPSPSGLGNQTVCDSGNVTFTVNDPGPGNFIQWTTDTNNINGPFEAGGSGPVSFTVSLSPDSAITVYANINLSCGGISAWVYATGTAIVCGGSSTWLGTYSSNWSDPNNWSPPGQPNSCAASVIIDQGATVAPVVDTAIQVGNITLTGSGTETIEVDSNLTICGNITINGGLTANLTGSGLVTLTGTADTLSGNISFQTLVVNSSSGGAMLYPGANVDIYAALNLQSGVFDATNGATTLKSASSTQIGIINDFTAGYTGTYTGNVTAERYFDASSLAGPTLYDNNQHMIGSPVSMPGMSGIATVTNGSPGYIVDVLENCDQSKSDPTSPYGTLFSYNEANGASGIGCILQSWDVEGSTGTMQNAQGYSYLHSGAGTLSITGPPNLNSSYAFNSVVNNGASSSLSNTGNFSSTTKQGNTYYGGYNLASNPYPATLSISILSQEAAVDAGFAANIYVYNTEGPSNGTWTATTTVPEFQGFFVFKTSSGTGGTYTINGGDRVTSGYQFYRQANNNTINITATNVASGLTDITTVGFNPNAVSSGFDPLYDAWKIPGVLGRHTLATVNNNRWMDINMLNSIETTGTVPMDFEPGVSGTYTLTFDGVNSFDATSYIMLEDLLTGTMYNIRNGAYTFASNATDDWHRFVLHFTPPAQINSTDATCEAPGMINIQQPGTADWNYSITNTSNATIASGTLNASTAVAVNTPAGVYTLTLSDNIGYSVEKNVGVNGEQSVTASIVASAKTVRQNQDITLSGTADNASVYSWNFGDGTSGTGVAVTHSYQTEGIYVVTLNALNASGCTSQATQNVTVTSRSATGAPVVNGNEQITVWSNANLLYIDFTKLPEVQATINVYNVLGQKMYSDKFTDNTVYTKQINNIEIGYIIVQVINNDNIITKKVFISNDK